MHEIRPKHNKRQTFEMNGIKIGCHIVSKKNVRLSCQTAWPAIVKIMGFVLFVLFRCIPEALNNDLVRKPLWTWMALTTMRRQGPFCAHHILWNHQCEKRIFHECDAEAIVFRAFFPYLQESRCQCQQKHSERATYVSKLCYNIQIGCFIRN